jgi:hypothetical protein
MDSNLLTEGLIDKYIEEQASDMTPYHRLAPKGIEAEDEQKRILINLNKKVLKSMYSPYTTNDELNATDIIGILLLHFRFMTPEQSRILFPGFSEKILYSKNTKQRKNSIADSVLISEGGKSKCYFLNASGFDRYRNGKFGPSEEYLSVARIPKYFSNTGIEGNQPGTGGKQLLHNVNLRDVPYKCLSISEYAQFDWYTGIALITGYTPRQSVQKAIEDDLKRTQDNAFQSNTKGSLIADAVMLFRTNTFIVEEDRGTENSEKFKNKISSYERYLEGQTDIQNIRLLVPVDCGKEDNRSIATGSGTRTIKNIDIYIKEYGNKDLRILFEEIKENPHGISARKRTAMLKLLNEFLSDFNGEQTERALQFNDLKDFVSHKAESKKEALASDRTQKNKRRQQSILNMFKELDVPNSGLRKSILSGVSLTVTSTFKDHAYFITPYESGYLRKLAREIEESNGIKKGKAEIKSSLMIELNGTPITFKNCIRIQSDINRPAQIYILFEISCNYADYCRAKIFLETISSVDTNTQYHVLLLANEIAETVKFVRETNLTDMHCHDMEITFPKKNVYVRFYSYGQPNMSYFIPDKTGLPHPVRSL